MQFTADEDRFGNWHVWLVQGGTRTSVACFGYGDRARVKAERDAVARGLRPQAAVGPANGGSLPKTTVPTNVQAGPFETEALAWKWWHWHAANRRERWGPK